MKFVFCREVETVNTRMTLSVLPYLALGRVLLNSAESTGRGLTAGTGGGSFSLEVSHC